MFALLFVLLGVAVTGAGASCRKHISVVVDVSASVSTGSPTDDLIGPNPEEMKESLKEAMQNYLFKDHSACVALYRFASSAELVLDFMSTATMANRQAMLTAVDNLQFETAAPNYYTNWEAGLQIVLDREAIQHSRYLYLVTDGAPTARLTDCEPGSYPCDDSQRNIDAAAAVSDALQHGGVTVTAVGVGQGVTDAQLRAVSGPCNALGCTKGWNYFHVDTFRSLREPLSRSFEDRIVRELTEEGTRKEPTAGESDRSHSVLGETTTAVPTTTSSTGEAITTSGAITNASNTMTDAACLLPGTQFCNLGQQNCCPPEVCVPSVKGSPPTCSMTTTTATTSSTDTTTLGETTVTVPGEITTHTSTAATTLGETTTFTSKEGITTTTAPPSSTTEQSTSETTSATTTSTGPLIETNLPDSTTTSTLTAVSTTVAPSSIEDIAPEDTTVIPNTTTQTSTEETSPETTTSTTTTGPLPVVLINSPIPGVLPSMVPPTTTTYVGGTTTYVGVTTTAASCPLPAGSGLCLADLFGSTPLCTSNDLASLATTVVSDVSSCIIGETITVNVTIKVASTATERFDMGFQVATDGGDAVTGTCENFALQAVSQNNTDLDVPSGNGPYYNGEIGETCDVCGDIRGIDGVNTRFLPGIDVLCVDNGGGEVGVSVCVSWSNISGNSVNPCTGPDDTRPSQTSKCECLGHLTGVTPVPTTGPTTTTTTAFATTTTVLGTTTGIGTGTTDIVLTTGPTATADLTASIDPTATADLTASIDPTATQGTTAPSSTTTSPTIEHDLWWPPVVFGGIALLLVLLLCVVGRPLTPPPPVIIMHNNPNTNETTVYHIDRTWAPGAGREGVLNYRRVGEDMEPGEQGVPRLLEAPETTQRALTQRALRSRGLPEAECSSSQGRKDV